MGMRWAWYIWPMIVKRAMAVSQNRDKPAQSSIDASIDNYAALHAGFRWAVPERFNIAEACCGRWSVQRDAIKKIAVYAYNSRPDGPKTLSFSYKALQQQANRLSNVLRARGVQRGDRVAIVMPQRFETAVAYIAVLQMGAVAMPLSMLFGPEALEYRLLDAGAVAAICDAEAWPGLQAVRGSCPLLHDCLVVGAATPGAVNPAVNDGAGDGDNSNFAERLALPHGSSPFGCCGFKTPSYEQAYAYKVDANGLPISVEGQTLKRLSSGASDVLDPRIDFTMGRTDVPYLDWGVQKDDWVRGQGYAGWYSPKKNAHASKDPSLSGSWAGNQLSPLNIELMRYSDLLLMLAECEVEAGSLMKAQELVNMVRVRAGKCAQGKSAIAVPMNAAEITWAKYNVKPYTAVWTDKVAARDAVRLERRLELALEGHRIFDLQRWGIYQTIMPKYHAREKMLINVFSGVGAVEAKHNMFPLPNTEIQRSEGALKQNQGF